MKTKLFILWISLFAISSCDRDIVFQQGIEDGYADTYPRLSQSNYADVLVSCIDTDIAPSSCTFDTLPLIGMEKANPTIDDIMERVVVSHDWMADNFRRALEELPADMLELLKGVSAVVIDDDIRPSHYRSGTGAIYIDPRYLWLTENDKATITRKDDYRSGYDDELIFVYLWRYVKDGESAYRSYDIDDSGDRSLDDMLIPLARLLYHELGHANDYFPSELVSSIDRSLTYTQVAINFSTQRTSYILGQTWPLQSDDLLAMSYVKYRGYTATEEQKATDAATMAGWFEPDLASDFYNFRNTREDMAMMFEEAMMKYHYDIDRDIAFTNLPVNDSPSCNDYIITWGTRNRVAAPQVVDRAAYVINRIIPDNAAAAIDYFYDLGNSTDLTPGQGWCDSKADPDISSSRQLQTVNESGRDNGGQSPPYESEQWKNDLKPSWPE